MAIGHQVTCFISELSLRLFEKSQWPGTSPPTQLLYIVEVLPHYAENLFPVIFFNTVVFTTALSSAA